MSIGLRTKVFGAIAAVSILSPMLMPSPGAVLTCFAMAFGAGFALAAHWLIEWLGE